MQSQVNDHSTMIVVIEKSLRELEAGMTLAGFLPDGCDWANTLMERTDSWRHAVKMGTERELISPVAHIGSSLIGLLMQCWGIQTNFPETDHPSLTDDKMTRWVKFHEKLLAKHQGHAAEYTLNVMVVQKKGPRYEKGEAEEGRRRSYPHQGAAPDEDLPALAPGPGLIEHHIEEKGGYMQVRRRLARSSGS